MFMTSLPTSPFPSWSERSLDDETVQGLNHDAAFNDFQCRHWASQHGSSTKDHDSITKYTDSLSVDELIASTEKPSTPKQGYKAFHTKRTSHAQEISSSLVTPKDVLFGRGRNHRGHSGNDMMRKFALRFRDVYDQCVSREEKTKITRHIVDSIQRNGGRFLKYNKCSKRWYAVSDEEARQKVSHFMRDHPTAKRKWSGGIGDDSMLTAPGALAPMLSPACLQLSSEEADLLIEMFCMEKRF